MKMTSRSFSKTIIAILALATVRTASAEVFPPASQNLVLTAPVTSWDEAIPLGNGLTGGLLWGADGNVHLGLDRGDIWDERPNGPKEWWKTEVWSKGGGSMWDKAYFGATPSKLPVGRVEFKLADGVKVTGFELNYATAEGIAKLSNGQALRVFFSAENPVALVRIPGTVPQKIEVLTAGNGGLAKGLGYPPAETGTDGGAKWYIQTTAEGLKYCVCLEARLVDNETVAAIAITTNRDAPDLLALARKRCADALGKGYDAMLAPHVKWWAQFWAQSSVSVPEEDVQQQYTFVRYLYGAGSRRGAPPLPLQGVWTQNTGGLPPWKGDYHSDLNTEMTYIAYYETGDFDEGLSYLDFLWNLSPVFRQFAKDFYQTDGLAMPAVMSLAGQPLGGWPPYSLSPVMSAWTGHLFYLHWRYTMDDDFLKNRAYPWCSAVGQCLEGLLKPGKNGVLLLPRSSSPEFHNSVYLTPNTNFDIMCMRMFFLDLKEMADAQGKSDEAAHWLKLAGELGDYHTAPDGELLVADHLPLRMSHRHLSNIIALYPFNLITREGSDLDRQRIAATLARPEWNSPTHGPWCGYSWAWMSCLRARVGDAEGAVRHLDVYLHAYLSRNGFHLNYDHSHMNFGANFGRPFTLEGNFLALQAVQEMLLQSWSPTPGQRDTEIIRIFPATPWRWHDASFTDLRAEGGHQVSARRENNATTWFRIVAGKDGEVRIRDDFGGRELKWSQSGVTKKGDNFVANLKKGETLEASLAKPTVIPPAPADLAVPVVIGKPAFVASNTLPLCIGAANDNGGGPFTGEIARVVVKGQALTSEEIAALANRENIPSGEPIAVTRKPQQIPALTDDDYRFDGKGWLEVPNTAVPDCAKGLTLAAWIRPEKLISSGARIFSKYRWGDMLGYVLCTYPRDSLTLQTRSPDVGCPEKLPIGEWTHIAATVDGETGKRTLYINGKAVAGK